MKLEDIGLWILRIFVFVMIGFGFWLGYYHLIKYPNGKPKKQHSESQNLKSGKDDKRRK